MEYEIEKKIDWDWQSIDGAMTKAPLGGRGGRAQIPLTVAKAVQKRA